jgi:hypothetical protein
MAKGGGYEREICKKLSLWWSGGKDDDLFWRSSQSGGRATSRFKKNKTTRGHCGDICATDSSGEPLVKLVTIEVKRGYNSCNLAEVLDKPRHLKQNLFESFIEQSISACSRAGTPYWMLIHRRDSRMAMVYFSRVLYKTLSRMTIFDTDLSGSVLIRTSTNQQREVFFACMKLDTFLEAVDPGDIRVLAQGL